MPELECQELVLDWNRKWTKILNGDLIERTAPAGGLSLDAQTRMLKNLTDNLLGETAGEFKGLQDPKIRGGPYSPLS